MRYLMPIAALLLFVSPVFADKDSEHAKALAKGAPGKYGEWEVVHTSRGAVQIIKRAASSPNDSLKSFTIDNGKIASVDLTYKKGLSTVNHTLAVDQKGAISGTIRKLSDATSTETTLRYTREPGESGRGTKIFSSYDHQIDGKSLHTVTADGTVEARAHLGFGNGTGVTKVVMGRLVNKTPNEVWKAVKDGSYKSAIKPARLR